MKRRKLVSVMLAIVLVTGLVGFSAEARAISSYYVSAGCDTDGWTSFEKDVVVSMTSQKSDPKNTDVGVFITAGNVGLPGGYIESPNRQLHVCIMEQDGFLSPDDVVRYFYGQFGIDSTGTYKILDDYQDSTENAALGSYSIETSNVLELYIEAIVDPVSGDPGSGIPEGVFKYAFWCD